MLSRNEIFEIVAQLTLEEKASLCSGAEMFATKAIERLDIPAVHLADGPHGLRKQEGRQDFLGQNASVTATCFPAACVTGSGFDPALMEEMGHMLGRLCQAKDVQVLLGPGVNIKRSPLCGRNFEYLSEDPLVSGVLGTAYVKGVQAEGVGTSLKHFLANNQETRRRTQSSYMDQRTLREIYTPAFERVVKEAKPWTVMSSYNKFNRRYVNESPELCKKLLRDEWGFDGMMVSDWAAVHDRVAVIKGGCALTMPDDKAHDSLIVDAVKDGILNEGDLDECCADIVALALRARENRRPDTKYDFEEAHSLARRIAGECMVLLKNEDNFLPLNENSRIAIIGAFAGEPQYQGAGSSRVNAYRVPGLPDVTSGLDNVVYAEGFGKGGSIDEVLQAEAVSVAQNADIAIIVAGLPDTMESEGYDRWVMKLPECQNDLIERVCAVQPNTVVVLQNGSPVEMPWVEKPKAIVEAYLGGEAVSEAIWDVLTGVVSPSGHLAETFPKRLEDNPSYLSWPGEGDRVEYQEGIFVGYRYYESKSLEVLFPFGHGLTYTNFAYSDLKLSQETFESGQTMTASVNVTNTGDRSGKTLVQLYVGVGIGETAVRRPVRELRGFEKVMLEPGETKTVVFTLDKRSFAHWDVDADSWRVAGGRYEVQIGVSVADIVLKESVLVEDEYISSGQIYDLMSPICDVRHHPAGKEFLARVSPMIEAVINRMGMDRRKQDEMPYVELRPKMSGFEVEPLQTIKRMLPSIPESDWDQLFKELNS